MMQRPSVGRIVHFHGAHQLPVRRQDSRTEYHTVTVAGPPLAAMILRCGPDGEGMVLEVFPPDGPSFKEEDVAFSEEPKPGYWSWPPRA